MRGLVVLLLAALMPIAAFAQGTTMVTTLAELQQALEEGKDDITIYQSSFTIPTTEKVTIPAGVTLRCIENSRITNNGTIDISNGGTLLFSTIGNIDNYGTVNNDGTIDIVLISGVGSTIYSYFRNYDTVNNHGTINVNSEFVNGGGSKTACLYNYGTINVSGRFENLGFVYHYHGTINSIDGGVITRPDLMYFYYRVFFDSQGGDAVEPQWIAVGASISYDIDIPSREGYAFLGWFTEPIGGEAVGRTYYEEGYSRISVYRAEARDYTFYVQWEEIVEPEPEVVVVAMTTDAKSIVGITEAVKGDWTVTFIVTVTCDDGSTEDVEYTVTIPKNGDGTIDMDDYTLIYDIKGNGSNVKVFRIEMK